MTREERGLAIGFFELHRRIFCDNHLKNCPKNSNEYIATLIEKSFYDMAIKALEKESCEDAVSRQTVKEQMIYYGFHAPDMTVTEFVEDCLPSVTPHQATCEEREKGECPFYAG